MILIEPLDHRDPEVAAQIHTILMRAYAQEAALLQASHFEPLDRTVAAVQAGREQYHGAFRLDTLAGCVSIEPDDEPGQWLVAALVVHPAHQRRGVARALMGHVLQLAGNTTVAVATGVRNGPALALYGSLGFVPYRYGTIGVDELPLVKLRRSRTT